MGRKARYALAALALALLLGASAVLAQSLHPAGQDPEAKASAPPVATVVPTPVPTQTVPPVTPAARLAVDSQPQGATVVVDGKERGSTPLVVSDLDAGSHAVKLLLEGRQVWQTELGLSPDETKRMIISLEEISTPVPTPTEIPDRPLYPVAVMVENLIDARPQSGLARADVVYEALVEGGITRFMAVYTDGIADTIGPVRSARHYFVYLAAEFNASYVHIGSSPQGYEALKATGITRLDETYGDPGFWRSSARYAPHNAYTSTDLVRSSLDRVRNATPGSLAGFQFRSETSPVQGAEAGEISLVYPGGYRVTYVYSAEEKLYPRYMEGLPHRDANTGEQVSPRNLVVQYVPAWLIPGDDAGRLDMEQLGEGKALFFRDGAVTEGYWQKPSYGNCTEWYDGEWKPLGLNPGKTWVQIVPPSVKVSY